MDPANYVNHKLPKIEYNDLEHLRTYSLKRCYGEFCADFKAFVSGDCDAITVDDEILFNNYEPKSLRDSILDDMFRQNIIDNPHNLLVRIIDQKKNAHMILYMCGNTPWFIAVYYNHLLRIFTIESYKSQKYIDTYETIMRPPRLY